MQIVNSNAQNTCQAGLQLYVVAVPQASQRHMQKPDGCPTACDLNPSREVTLKEKAEWTPELSRGMVLETNVSSYS